MNKKLAITLMSILLVLIIVDYSGITGMFLTQSSDNDYNIRGLFTQSDKQIKNDYVLDIVIGQDISENSIRGKDSTAQPGNYNLCLGALCLYQGAVYDISLTGNLEYTDTENKLEAGSRVFGKVKYASYEKEVIAIIGEDGSFYIELLDIPEGIVLSDFKIELFVEGQVDAIYTCTHKTIEEEYIDGEGVLQTREIHKCCKFYNEETGACN